MWCPKDSYDPNSSYFFATEGTVIKNLIDRNILFKPFNLLIFTSVWYFFMCVSYGTNVPAGLFLPGVIVGCAMGDLVFIAGDSIEIFGKESSQDKDGIRHSYIILGCAAFMAGYTRMTYCLAILIMETT